MSPELYPTIDEYDRLEEEGLVSVRWHPILPLVVINYTPKCTYERAWNESTLKARGLVFHAETGELLARPYDKFFSTFEGECKPPEGLPSIMSDKMDGNLGIGFNYQGKMIWTTRGSFESPGAQAATKLWDNREPILPGHTLLAEIIASETKIIVDYKYQDLVVLDIRKNDTGEYIDKKEVYWSAKSWRLPMTTVKNKPPSLQDMCQRAQHITNPTVEGWVLEWPCGYRVKVKTAGYMRIAKFIQGLSERRIADLWYHNQEIPQGLPEKYLHTLDTEYQKYNSEVMETGWRTEKVLYAFIKKNPEADLRDIAEHFQKHPFFALIMQYARKREPNLKLFIYKRHFKGNPR